MSFHPSIDEAHEQHTPAAHAEGFEDGAQRIAFAIDEFHEALLAVGEDISRQLGRIADHLTIEAIASQAEAFGRYPAGHPASQWPERPVTVHQHFNGDPNVATRDEAAVALDAAQSV